MTYCGVLLVWFDTDASILANRSTGFILKAVLQLAKRLGMVSYLFARQCGGVTSFLHLLLSLFLLTQWGLTTHIWTGSSVVQIMAHHLFGAKPLPQPVLTYSQWEPCKQISKECESECTDVFQGNAVENVVCKVSNILFSPQWVKKTNYARIIISKSSICSHTSHGVFIDVGDNSYDRNHWLFCY